MSLLIEKGYTPNDIDSMMMLSEVPLEILQENISNQFHKPFDVSKTDYVALYIMEYMYSKDVLDNSADEEELEALEFMRVEFISFMQNVFEKELDIAFPELNDMSDEDQQELIQFTYRYFIVNIRQNFYNLILNCLDKYKRDICDIIPTRKDVITLSYKKDIDDPDDILIMSNLNSVIDHILSRDFTVDEFLQLTIRDDMTAENCLIQDFYDEFKVVGNFIEKYIRMINKGFKIELESVIRSYILKKYVKYLPKEQKGE